MKGKPLEFYKYQGTGNDFVMIDDRTERFNQQDQMLIARLCDRHFGIGADGLILIRNHAEADFEMIYFNADGRPASLCGNGSRCAVQFARKLGIIAGTAQFMTVEGLLTATVDGAKVSLRLPQVHAVHQEGEDYFLDTGSPHHVCFIAEGLKAVDVYTRGRSIRNSEKYQPEGVNVNFVERMGVDTLYVRTYERGVENETYSCGTGVTASAVAFALRGAKSPVRVETPGGQLEVSFRQTGATHFEDIYLSGPAEEVFQGSIRL